MTLSQGVLNVTGKIEKRARVGNWARGRLRSEACDGLPHVLPLKRGDVPRNLWSKRAQAMQCNAYGSVTACAPAARAVVAQVAAAIMRCR
jgi:hypothetical protein